MSNLPKYLQKTDAEIATEAEVQEQRRAGFTRAHLTEAEALVSRGALLEQTARGNLAAGTDATPQLAEALAMQGRYREAAEHHPDAKMKQHYQQIDAAIELDDDARCNCPDTETEDLTITPRYNVQTIFSAKHGGTVALVKCVKCGHLNARPARSRLLNQQAAINQNTAAIKGGRGVSDAQILRKSNGTRVPSDV